MVALLYSSSLDALLGPIIMSRVVSKLFCGSRETRLRRMTASEANFGYIDMR